MCFFRHEETLERFDVSARSDCDAILVMTSFPLVVTVSKEYGSVIPVHEVVLPVGLFRKLSEVAALSSKHFSTMQFFLDFKITFTITITSTKEPHAGM